MSIALYRLAVRLRPLWRAILFLNAHWFSVLIAAFILSPVGPHVHYGGGGLMAGTHISSACLYFGSRGTVRTYHHGVHCPLIVILDSRQRRP